MKTIWFTGISAAGKTTLAKQYRSTYNPYAILVDGDEIRKIMNPTLGYENNDRFRNVETASRICKLLNDDGHIALATMSSPLEEQRKRAFSIIERKNVFLVYVSCPLETAISRDPKGLYAKYYKNEITNMAGLDIPYETPDDADLVLNTDFFDVHTCVKTLHESLIKRR
jgi:adenylyl-sulfate kinase